MGCDIHLSVEAKGGEHGRWRRLDRTISIPDWRSTTPYRLDWGDHRNYNAFAMLANVRNGFGFAGIDLGEGFEPIDTPRGLPADCSIEVQEDSDNWGVDGHSHSWFTLRELLNLEHTGYWNKVTTHRGMITEPVLEKAREQGIVKSESGSNVVLSESPDTWAGWISGEMAGNVYSASWEETYRESAGWLLHSTIPAMVEITSTFALNDFLRAPFVKEGERKHPVVFSHDIIRGAVEPMDHWIDAAELVRMVFWFDN